MGSVMGIDAHNLVSKMEGFAIQGVKGTELQLRQTMSDILSTRGGPKPSATHYEHSFRYSRHYQQ